MGSYKKEKNKTGGLKGAGGGWQLLDGNKLTRAYLIFKNIQASTWRKEKKKKTYNKKHCL